MTSYDPPENNYDTKGLEFCTDSSGRQIATKRQKLVAAGSRDDVIAAVEHIIGEMKVRPELDEPVVAPTDRRLRREGWIEYDLAAGLDAVRVASRLRELGITAHPVHVYFSTSLPSTNPNYFTSTFTPNYFTPNYFTPNYFTPNYFTPNYFTPNYFTPADATASPGCGRHVDGGAEVACPCLAAAAAEPGRPHGVPKHRARPVVRPIDRPGAVDQNVEIHVVDVGSDPPQQWTDDNRDAWLDPAAGHGHFVRSIVFLGSRLDAAVWAAGSSLGVIDDIELSDVLAEIDDVSDPAAPRVLNLSLAGYAENDEPNPMIAEQVVEMIASGWVIVAAAGNDGSCRPTWPAALPGVVAVGAIGPMGPAPFTNYGPWVDACAPGVGVVAEFPDLSGLDPPLKVAVDSDRVLHTGDYDTGWAVWSGTSFSAPLVAARIAVRLNEGDPVPIALGKVIEAADLPRIPMLGTVIQ